MTAVYRAYSPTRGKAGATFSDYARAQSLAAVRNQFAATDLDAGLPADWIVQAGHVEWETP